MQKVALVALAVVVLVAISGCGGPFKLSRTFDDWRNQQYVNDPWLWGNILSTSIFNFVSGILGFVDMVALNLYDFWAKSAWPFGTGVGTPFQHKAVTVPKM